MAREAVTAALAALGAEGCITGPTTPAPALTVDDAAKLLCRTSGTVRLNDPDVDYEQLVVEGGDGMVEYAWANTLGQGLTGVDLVEATAARRLLMRHHGRL